MFTRTLVDGWLRLGCRCLVLLTLAGTAAATEYTHLPASTTHEQALTLRLQKLEELLAQTNDYQRFILLDTAAKTAFELKQYDAAAVYARELIRLAPRYPEDWNYPPALHHANIILGRSALLKDDINAAKSYLLAASKVPPSSILDTNGADLELASALLARGQRETVAEYLSACKLFWPRGRDQLERWLQQLAAGKIPSLQAPGQAR